MKSLLAFAASSAFLIQAVVAQQPAASSFVKLTPEDEAAVRAIVMSQELNQPNPHLAADLDWENAFGIRYFNLAKRDKFYHQYVTPLQQNDTSETMEVKVRFPTTDTAIADAYWHEIGQLDITTHKPGPDRWGRTTYFLTKKDGIWTEVLERVADLRLPYYKHYDALPKAVPVPAKTLAAYAGNYTFVGKPWTVAITVEGDHLVWTSKVGVMLGIPQSETQFLLFDANDQAEYQKLTFTKSADDKITAKIVTEVDDLPATIEKQP